MRTQEDSQKRAEQADRHGQHHRERNGPAFIQRGEKEEDQKGGGAEDKTLLPLGDFLLVRRSGPLVAVSGREVLIRDLLHGGRSLAGTESRPILSDDPRGAEPVVTVDHLGSGHGLDGNERAQRDHVSVGCADVEAVDALRALPVLRFSLHHDFPSPAKSVEVVDIKAAEEGLESVVNVGDRDTERLRLVGVEVDLVLRHARAQSAVRIHDFSTAARSVEQRLRDFR